MRFFPSKNYCESPALEIKLNSPIERTLNLNLKMFLHYLLKTRLKSNGCKRSVKIKCVKLPNIYVIFQNICQLLLSRVEWIPVSVRRGQDITWYQNNQSIHSNFHISTILLDFFLLPVSDWEQINLVQEQTYWWGQAGWL